MGMAAHIVTYSKYDGPYGYHGLPVVEKPQEAAAAPT
jgi:hypothetical protein